MEGRPSGATTKKVLTVRREGVKARAYVQGKGQGGRKEIPIQRKTSKIIEGGGGVYVSYH